MIRKKSCRRVFLIEVCQNDKVLGYYAGKDWDNSVVIKDLSGAMIIKTEKGISHIVTNLEKRYSDIYSFRVVEAIESQTVVFCDEYDIVNGAKRFFAILVKDKADLLTDGCFVSEIDKNEPNFKTTFAIEKAMLLGDRNSLKAYRFLSSVFHEKYKFYQEKIYVKKESSIELIAQ